MNGKSSDYLDMQLYKLFLNSVNTKLYGLNISFKKLKELRTLKQFFAKLREQLFSD